MTGSVSSVVIGRVAGVAIIQADKHAAKAKRGAPKKGLVVSDAEVAADDSWGAPAQPQPNLPARAEVGAGDTYAHVQENAFFATKNTSLGTFALDVDNASYTNVRCFLNEGHWKGTVTFFE